MLIDFWQLKINLYVLLLASCIGQGLFRSCYRNYCYERSVERRTRELNDLREVYNSRGHNIQREEWDNSYNRFNEIDELIRRHLDDRESTQRRDENQRERVELRESLKRLNDRESQLVNNRRTEENRQLALRLGDNRVERLNEVIPLDDTKSQLDVTKESQDNIILVELSHENQDESTERRDKNKRERVERHESLRQLDDRESQRDGNRRSEDNREMALRADYNPVERLNKVTRFDDRETRRDISRLLRNNRHLTENLHKKPSDIELRRINERHFQREQKSTKRRDDNKREPIETHESLRRLGDREEYSGVNRRSEDNQQVAEHLYENQRDTPESQQINERLFHSKRVSIQRGDENKREREDEALSQRECGLKERCDENQRELVELNESLKRVEDRESQRNDNRRLEVYRGLSERFHGNQHDERRFQRDRKSTQRFDENNRERVESHESLRLLGNRDVRRRLEDNRRFAEDLCEHQRDIPKSRRTDERLSQMKRELRERGDESNKDQEDLLRKLSQRRDENHRQRVESHECDVRKRLEYNRELAEGLNGNQHNEYQRERTERYESLIQLVEQKTQRLDEHVIQRDVSTLSDDTRNSQYTIERLSQRERVRGHETTRHLGAQRNDNSLSENNVVVLRNDDKQLRERQIGQRLDEEKGQTLRQLERKHVTKFSIDYLEFRNSNRGLFLRDALKLDTESNIVKENSYRHTHRDEIPTVFLTTNYLILGQGTILAFIIKKTLNGKYELKDQLPQILREAVGTLVF